MGNGCRTTGRKALSISGQTLDTNLSILYNMYTSYKEVCVWSACLVPLRRERISRNW
jgi:hypothetical protein